MMRLLVIVYTACCIAACSADSAPLIASDVVITKPIPGTQMSAGYLALTNGSGEGITITKVSSPEFRSVQLHESVVENGIARMVALDELAISPNQTVRLERGGKHLMLMQPLDEIHSVTLQFHSGDNLVLSVNAAVED